MVRPTTTPSLVHIKRLHPLHTLLPYIALHTLLPCLIRSAPTSEHLTSDTLTPSTPYPSSLLLIKVLIKDSSGPPPACNHISYLFKFITRPIHTVPHLFFIYFKYNTRQTQSYLLFLKFTTRHNHIF